jgi:hypothetical protein
VGFLKSREQAKAELRVITSPAANPTSPRVAENQDRVREEVAAPPSELDQRFDLFWDGLSDSEREQFEKDALEQAEAFNQRFYIERKERGGSLFKTVQRKILIGYFGSKSVSA